MPKLALLVAAGALLSMPFPSAPLHAQTAPAEPAVEAGSQALHFVEFQWVNQETSSIEEARDFIRWARDLAARHDVDLQVNVLVTGVAKGGTNAQVPDFIFVYTFPNQQTMTDMQTDPDYQARLRDRNRIFDFSRNTIWRVERLQ